MLLYLILSCTNVVSFFWKLNINLLCFSHKMLISTAISSYIAFKYCKFSLSLLLEEELNGIYQIFNSQFKVLSF